MDCTRAVSEMIEAARRRAQPDGGLEEHMESCPRCAERWQLEDELASHLRLLRITASGSRSSLGSREDLMRQFTARHWRLVHPAWGVGLAAAAALLIAMGTLRGPLFNAGKPQPAPPPMGAWLSANAWSIEPSPDFDTTQDEGYTAVPYAAPLAPGERLSVMRAELYPAVLATLGVNIDPAVLAASETPTVLADVVVGEDGLPRAVRLTRADEAGGF